MAIHIPIPKEKESSEFEEEDDSDESEEEAGTRMDIEENVCEGCQAFFQGSKKNMQSCAQG